MKVYQAITAVQMALSKEGISKSRNNAQQGYKFRGIDDVYNALSPMLAANQLCILPRCLSRTVVERTTQKGGVLFYVCIEAEFDFVSAEDGSKHTVKTFGEAMDSGDKASNKAMSAALKYCLTESLLIPTYEVDRDTEEHSPQVAPRPPPAPPASKPSPPSNVRPINGAPSQWEVRINEAQTCAALALVGAALQREPEAVRNAHRPLYTARNTELAARERAQR